MELRIAAVGTRLGGRWVLNGVDATPPPGALTGLLGPNGAGKSTLLRTIAGLLRPEAGAVLVGERAVHEIPRRERARHIALLEQENATVTDLTAAEVVALGRIPHRRWAAHQRAPTRSVMRWLPSGRARSRTGCGPPSPAVRSSA